MDLGFEVRCHQTPNPTRDPFLLRRSGLDASVYFRLTALEGWLLVLLDVFEYLRELFREESIHWEQESGQVGPRARDN